MPKVAQGGLRGDLRGGKGDRRGAKIESVKRKGSPASERGHFKHTGQCLALRGVTILIEGMKSLSKGTRN